MDPQNERPNLRLGAGVSKYAQRGIIVGVTCCYIPQNTQGGEAAHTNQSEAVSATPTAPTALPGETIF